MKPSLLSLNKSNCRLPFDGRYILLLLVGFLHFFAVQTASGKTNVSSNNANLANLTISRGILSPAFSSDTTSFYVYLLKDDNYSFFFTPTTSDPAASITVNGATVFSGNPVGGNILSQTYPITNFIIVVTAGDRVTQKKYYLGVAKTLLSNSNNANLVNLAIGTWNLSPPFTPATTNYSVTVSNATMSITITPTPAPYAEASVNGQWVLPGASKTVVLSAGRTTIIPIVVLAGNNVTKNNYTITVTRQVIVVENKN